MSSPTKNKREMWIKTSTNVTRSQAWWWRLRSLSHPFTTLQFPNLHFNLFIILVFSPSVCTQRQPFRSRALPPRWRVSLQRRSRENCLCKGGTEKGLRRKRGFQVFLFCLFLCLFFVFLFSFSIFLILILSSSSSSPSSSSFKCFINFFFFFVSVFLFLFFSLIFFVSLLLFLLLFIFSSLLSSPSNVYSLPVLPVFICLRLFKNRETSEIEGVYNSDIRYAQLCIQIRDIFSLAHVYVNVLKKKNTMFRKRLYSSVWYSNRIGFCLCIRLIVIFSLCILRFCVS